MGKLEVFIDENIDELFNSKELRHKFHKKSCGKNSLKKAVEAIKTKDNIFH